MVKANLLGYVRKTKSGNAIKVSISTEAFDKAERYSTLDGREFVSMIVNISKIQQILEGQKEVTGISQLVG